MSHHAPARVNYLTGIGLAALLAFGCADEGDAPPRFETAAYQEIDRSFQPLRRDFEGEAGRARLVAVATPTCGFCIEGIEAIYSVLMPRLDQDDVSVFVLWAGVTPGDTGPRTAKAAEMFADSRFRHYFDQSGRIARAFGSLMGLESGRNVTGIFLLYAPDDTWDPRATMMDEPDDYNALLEGWLPAAPQYFMGEHAAVPMPIFDINAMEQQIRMLLSE